MGCRASRRERERKALVKIETANIDGVPVRWLHAPGPPILWLHGVPDSADLWTPFLERAGGIAVDLPGFGQSGKPAEWPYSIAGYERFLQAFADHLGLDRVRVVAHDWGVLGLALGERIERLALLDVLPFLPGHRWPWPTSMWRRPLAGELLMGTSSAFTLRRLGGLGPDHATAVMRHFDHGTQRAILKLYRSTSAEELASRAPLLAAVKAPALVLWGEQDRFLPSSWAQRIADALGGEATAETVPGAGHWAWMDRPEVIDRVTTFIAG
jgi:pimeloyl-ACP methyl ester carboxylesterase